MRINRERYQHGSVRKVPRAQGFAWEFRYYDTTKDGSRKLRVQTFDSVKFPTERDVRKAVEGPLESWTANGCLVLHGQEPPAERQPLRMETF
jgi:hypothetical protein